MIRQEFADCRAKAPSLQCTIMVADCAVELIVHGAEAARHLDGVFRHVRTIAATAPRLRIEIAQTAESYPSALSVPPPGTVAVQLDGPHAVELHTSLATVLDRDAGQATAIAGRLAELPSAHLSHPFAHLFGWLGAQRQAYVSHGAAIGRDGRGLLFAGSGGQGKSTTALACAAAGWSFAGDDFVMLDLQADGSYVAHALYATGRLHPAQAERFPALVERWDRTLSPEDNKLTLFPRDGAVSLVRRLTIDAIVLPMVGTGIEEVAPLPRSAALRALMADSVRIYPWLTRERMQFYAAAVEVLPCYALRVGPGIADIPGAVDRLLDRVRRR